MIGKILTAVAATIVIAGGAYWYFFMSQTPASEPAPVEQTAATPQVQGQDAVVGTGEEATPGSVVSLLYVGMLQDGTVFDSSANNNNEPLTFTLGTPGIIPGFQIGVNGMRVGGERRIQIPPELGFGSTDVRRDPTDPNSPIVIPANSTITFDLKLVSVGTSTPTE